MKKILAGIAAFVAAMPMMGQAANPQNTFSNAVNAANPSMYLNYNDATSAFKDQVSGDTMGNTLSLTTTATVSIGSTCNYGSATSSTLTCSLTATAGDTLVVFVYPTNAVTTLKTMTDSLGASAVLIANPTPGTYAYAFVNVSAGSHTVTATLASAISNAYPMMQVFDVAGASTTSPVDAYTFNSQGTATTAITSGAITTTSKGDMLIGSTVPTNNGGSTTITTGTSSFTIVHGPYGDQAGGYLVAGAAGSYTFNAVSSSAYTWGTFLVAIKPNVTTTTYTSGAVTPQQPGFDSTNAANYSAAFPYNGFSVAPNNSLGSVEWNTPWSLMVHVDRLNWTRSGYLILASKGDLGGCAGIGSSLCSASGSTNSWWQLYLHMAGSYSQLCLSRNGYGTPSTAGGSGTVEQTLCTGGSFDAMPNGWNYNIVVADAGTGASSALSMWLNGLQVGAALPATTYALGGFGEVSLNASGGTGYAATTAFTSSGGGPNCVVAGNMIASGGVPLTSNGFTFTQNSGCTSVPTITLTSPTGTGVTITKSLGGQLMNAANEPLMVPGFVNSGVAYGVAGSTTTQNATYLDEFAEFPSSLTFGKVSNLFYTTKFYQSVANLLSASNKPHVIFDEGVADGNSEFALSMVIGLHQAGLIRLDGVVVEDDSASAQAMWRQMLDQAGLADVPLGVPAEAVNNVGTTYAANVASFNASTPVLTGTWETAAQVYRSAFAKDSSSPIDIVSGGSPAGLYDFMSSAADGISTMTGLQLLAQDAANGGAIYLQGGGCTATAAPATTPCSGTIGSNGIDSAAGQYVTSHNGTMPMIWIGGAPQSAGPGVLSTRMSEDPLYLFSVTAGTDIRQCFDCLMVEALTSSVFTNGVQIGYSGGSGYASATPFTLSGGGTHCQGMGIMTASGGVPNGIEFNWGQTAYEEGNGFGSGCSSAPTINLVGATGTGVTLTAYPALVCGTVTVSGSGSSWSDTFSSATCSHHYTVPGNINTASTPASGALMTWFINSLVDPPPVGQPRTN